MWRVRPAPKISVLSEWKDAGRPDHTSLEPHLTAGPDGFGVNLNRR
jgi:hypothetical protein